MLLARSLERVHVAKHTLVSSQSVILACTKLTDHSLGHSIPTRLYRRQVERSLVFYLSCRRWKNPA